MRRTVFLIGLDDKLPSIEQLVERAFILLSEAYVRVGSVQPFDSLVEAAELLDKAGVRAQQLELLLPVSNDARDKDEADQSIADSLKISLAYCVEAQRALRDEELHGITYAITQAYYHLGMASGPKTQSERATELGRKKANDKFGSLKDEAIRLLQINCPDKSQLKKSGAINATFPQLQEFNDALYPEETKRDCKELLEAWCREDRRFVAEIDRIKNDTRENKKSRRVLK